ncbi:MAG: di-trans,poly-cis-decaprenylcistransferase [Candidatus Komeilibacteria bacterium]|nr:di-trans,poly-cis-decaprenylcistransferase [Candidatus Komeilibacteria bacterium]
MEKRKHIPQHVALIMDGNRRWAKKRGLPGVAGHQQGYERAVTITEYAFQRGVKFLTLFAFSTENWKRSAGEINFLMTLLKRVIREQTQAMHKKNIRVRFIGLRSRLSSSIVRAIDDAHALTQKNTKGTLQIALNYGGRAEIVESVKAIVRGRHSWSSISERLLSSHMQTAGVPDPDLIIRTSGEYRLSGFLLWQSAYSELFFSPKLWPAFTKADFDEALAEYALRQRRFGA